jgi:hypothetical protein
MNVAIDSRKPASSSTMETEIIESIFHGQIVPPDDLAE